MDSLTTADAVTSLARSRPVFHSEADFQHALAWVIQHQHPNARVRLETRPTPGVRLDIHISDPEHGTSLAVELKYLTRKWDGMVEGEAFALLNQGAQDIRAYDCVKDIQRVEQFTRLRPKTSGAVIILSNDPAYWRAPSHGRATNADAFRLHEGTVLTGTRSWGPHTGGTSQGRTDAIVLQNTYTCRWRDYSSLHGNNGAFRCLYLHVGGSGWPGDDASGVC